MGIAIGGKAVGPGDDLAIRGVHVAGIAINGQVVFEAGVAPPVAGWELIAFSGVPDVTTPAIDTTNADLLIVIGQTYLSQIPVPSDSKGNSWVLGVSYQPGTAGAGLYYCRGGVVGPGHTFTWVADYGGIQALAFRGSAVDPADRSSTNTVLAGTVLQPGAITPTQGNSLIVSGVSSNDNINSVDSGFIITENHPVTGGSMAGAAAYLVQTDAASFNPTWSIVNPGGYHATALIMSFKSIEVVPPVGLSIITSVVFGTARNNFNGWVGMALTIRQSSLIVSALGKWVLAGNTQPVNMLLTDQYGNIYRSAVLDVSSAPPDRFAYVTLDQPFTMVSGGIYCIFFQVTIGEDYWGANDAILTFGPDADVLAAYANPGFPERPAIQWEDPPNSYGPVNCLYQLA